MKKSGIWIVLCIVIAVLLLLLCILENYPQEIDPELSVPSTTETTEGINETTEETTEPATMTTQATAPEETIYWVFAHGGLRVRTGPGTAYELVGSLEDGVEIEVLTWKDGWAYIEKPLKGWCSGEYIHKLGWYKDVKTPESKPVQDDSLKGKWVHMTTPKKENGVWTSRAGFFLLRANGTFIHSVADYRKNDDGKWALANPLTDQPYWVGEYDYDGKQLTLQYMAELVEEYDQASGEPENREWVAWSYTLNLAVTQDAKFFTISNGSDIPLTVANEHAGATENTLYKAATGVGTPEDVSKILNQRYP